MPCSRKETTTNCPLMIMNQNQNQNQVDLQCPTTPPRDNKCSADRHMYATYDRQADRLTEPHSSSSFISCRPSALAASAA